jgi:hypothetical protein
MLVGFAAMALSSVMGCSGTGGEAPNADATADSDLRGGKTMTLAAFETAMNETAQWADNDPCSFSVTSESGGLKVSVTADGNTSTITISHKDAISTSSKASGDEEVDTYKIAGVGKVTVTNASDAFESVEVAPSGGKATTCEIDF